MNILLGITGSIAAYKAAILVRRLIDSGHAVRVIMTHSAKDFITPLTLATLSKNPILVENFNPENGDWNSHISLGEWADLYIIAPATANTIAKMAHGMADNLLTCTYLSARSPVMVAPAMDLDMFGHTATAENLETLRRRGVKIIEPGSGFLASGLTGRGRMEEPEKIAQYVDRFFAESRDLAGKTFIVTAGGTVEAIDPVRFISNYSTGKMGYAIAEELANRGAIVKLVSGQVTVSLSHPNVQIIKALSADQMYDATTKLFVEADGAVLCAAVADYTPKNRAEKKIKHSQPELSIELIRTKDIAAEVGKMKRPEQILVGFALETNDEQSNATEKLRRKNLDMIVLNSLNDSESCFGYDTNKITIISRDGTIAEFPLKSKAEVARDIVDSIIEKIAK